MMWEISPAYMQACLQQVYEYDEMIHAFTIKTNVEKLSGGENSGVAEEEAKEKKRPEKKKKKKYKPVALKVHRSQQPCLKNSGSCSGILRTH
jgi:hypothetical protein